MKVWRHLVGGLRKPKRTRSLAQRSVSAEQVFSGQAVGLTLPSKPKEPDKRLRGLALAGLYLGLVGSLFYLYQTLWLSAGHGWREVERLQTEVAAQQRVNATLLARNEHLRNEVLSLKQGADALEERARADLGMIREGETLIHLMPVD